METTIIRRKPILTISTSVITLMLVGTALAQTNYTADKPFSDISMKHANYTAIEYLRQENTVRGYMDGTFRPGERITRAEFLTLITNPFFLDQQNSEECIKVNIGLDAETVFFSDVKADAWFAKAVCVGKTKQVLDGYPDNTFRPGATITAAETMKVISNVLIGLDENDTDPKDWYKVYVKWMAEQNAIPTTVRSLTQPMTRGEVAEMIYRVKAGIKNKASVRYEALVR